MWDWGFNEAFVSGRGRDCVCDQFVLDSSVAQWFHTHARTRAHTHTHTHTLSIYLSIYLSVIQLSGQFSEKCRVFVKSALCHTLLPYCDPFTVDEGRYSPLPMCPQSCVQLEERCGREIREIGAKFAKFLAARCDKDVDVGGSGDKPGLIPITL